MMDPQQRLLMETVFKSILCAYKEEASDNSHNTGVMVGAWSSNYSEVTGMIKANLTSPFVGVGSERSVLCGRISYTYGFQGPSICTDTACSSSLVALHIASSSVLNLECEKALACGVSLTIGTSAHIGGSAANMLSSDGRCKTLDIRADGYAKGECCGVMRITPDIETQSATIDVVAKLGGCGINQDGRSSSLTAPNGPSQQTLIVDVLKRANYNASGVDRLEMHGTGTSLGDPIEVGAALEVLVSSPKSMQTTSSVPFLSSQKRNLTLEGAKTRTGHCEPGAVTNALGRQILTDASLMDEGMDSLAAVELGSALQTATGTSMPATLAFDYPTIDAIINSENLEFDKATNLKKVTNIAIGATKSLYGMEQLKWDQYKINPYMGTGMELSVLCGRISYTFGFKGPSVCVDTACSSSLVATQLAANTIISMESQIAYAGGVSLNIGLLSFQIGSAANMLSSDGRCKTLDIRADGYAKGECCGVMRITPDIETQSATIYVVAKLGGCGINQDGRSSSLTAPNGPSQQTLIVDVLKRANYNASGVDRLEMHGTGTSLGDPIEVGAALEVLVSSPKSMQTTSSVPFLSSQKRNLTLEGAKTRTGHCEPGAGESVVSLQWGAWEDTGMAARNGITLHRAVLSGIGVVSPEAGLAVLDFVNNSLSGALVKKFNFPVLGAIPFSWYAIQNDRELNIKNLTFLREFRISMVFSALPDSFEAGEVIKRLEPKSKNKRSSDMDAERVINTCSNELDIAETVEGVISDILGRKISPSASLMEEGVDSLMAVDIVSELISLTGRDTPSTIIYDYPTIESIRELDLKYTFRHAYKIENIDWNESKLFSIALNALEAIDPQSRLLLEVSHVLFSIEIEKGNNDQKKFKKTSVSIGGCNSGYERIYNKYTTNPINGIASFAATSASPSLLCGRISYTFGFKGPSVCVDTACSSSLVATQLAANTIISMESQIAYAGGVSLNIGLLSFQIGSAANMLSSDGRCKTLDIRADGYAKGECCGVMRITPDIETQSATIDVVAKLGGCGINQDGRSSSLTAPNGPSQQTLIVDVLKRANYNASEVDRLEMHGTGTSLGDPIEVGAALEVLVSSPKSMQTTSSVPFLSSQKRNLTLEGAKTRTGHCEPGAGTVGLMFAISRMSQRLISSLTHLRILTDASLMDEGMDSLAAVELGSTLQTATGTSMPATLAFDYPTIDAIVGFIVSSNSYNPRFTVHVGYAYTDLSIFDANLFGITPSEVEVMDPQQRLLLSSVYQIFYKVQQQNIKSNILTGIFVGAWASKYANITSIHSNSASPFAAVGSELSVLCGRISYTYGLQGPSICTDTACSSSLVALHIASSSVLNLECEKALACGVSLTIGTSAHIGGSAANMLSSDGRCKTLDIRADGYAKGECCGVMRITPDIETQSATIYVVAKLGGCGINQDGRSSSLTAPNGPSQQTLIVDVLKRANYNASGVDRLEMHGTGTSLGDPIEVGAALEVLVSSPKSMQTTSSVPFLSSQKRNLTLEGAKTRTGHCEPGAGTVGLMFAISRMSQRLISSLTHLRILTDASLMDEGMDSLAAVELGSTLQTATGTSMPATLAFDYPTIDAIVGFIVSSNSYNPRFTVHVGYAYTDLSIFDANLFGITPSEVEVMDPQQRLLLSSVYQIFYKVQQQNIKSNILTGIFVGAWASKYANITSIHSNSASPFAAVGSELSVLCGRISYTYGFQGPSICTDTACSSSLVALHIASSSVLNLECEKALACGVSLTIGTSAHIGGSAANMLSSDGRCKTLDIRADGYAKGECCGVMRITPDIETQSATIYVVAKLGGCGINQDGRSSSLTAPNGPSQQTLIVDVLKRANYNASGVDRLEMHGTGTSLGDPIEVGAALEVLVSSPKSMQTTSSVPFLSSQKRNLTLEGAKTRTGHCEPGAGTVGLMFAISRMSQRLISSLTHLRILTDASLMDEGMDSLAAVELGSTLQTATGTSMPATLAFDYPTIDAIVGFIVSSNSYNPRFTVHVGYAYTDLSIFDANLFGITPSEVEVMDPQQRLLLSSVYQIFYKVQQQNIKSNILTGIFVGAWASKYANITSIHSNSASPFAAVGSELSVLCGRISYTYGFQGPSICTDTACSSSLVALHIASSSVLNLECEKALACGVSLTIGTSAHIGGSAANMLSSDGRCKTLDIRADGYAKGECCGVMRITPDIETQSATIYVVAKLGGCGINQDGRSSSLTAPNGPSQQTLIVDVLKRANYNASGVDRLEMHGTGTSLGDPIEVGAALEVLVSSPKSMQTTSSVPFLSSQKRNLTLEGAKTRTGHCEPGAGTVGLMFAISRMSQRLISSLTHLRILTDASLMDEGMDSLAAVELGSTLQTATGTSMPATLAFDYPTIDAIVGFIVSSNSYNPRFTVHVGYAYTDLSIFDANLFGITPSEVEVMDPQQRLLLSSVYQIFYKVQQQNIKSNILTGIFVGAWASKYANITSIHSNSASPFAAVGSELSVLCGRISYTYGFQGPSICTDTACSSSLVALHIASSSVLNLECEKALACGVSLTIGTSAHIGGSAANMLSSDGRCKTLDIRADGYAKGECCGVMRITPDIETQSATIDVVAKLGGCGINQDGRSSSLTAPNGPSQQTLIVDVLKRANYNASGVDRLEMHGTGTSLGDPIEVGAALEVLVSSPKSMQTTSSVPFLSSQKRNLTLEGAKTRTGHCEPGAGTVGLMFAISRMSQRLISSLTHLRILTDASLMDEGMDSLAAVELGSTLQTATGTSMPATLAFDYPTIDAIVGFVAASSFKSVGSGVHTEGTHAIEVSGINSSFMEQNDLVSDLQVNISCSIWFTSMKPLYGISRYEEMSRSMKMERFNSLDMNCSPALSFVPQVGYYIDFIDEFDVQAFKILQAEVEMMDPQQRLLMETVFKSILCAYKEEASDNSHNTGVMVGAWSSNYSEVTGMIKANLNSPFVGVGSERSVLCGRISYTYGFQGPSICTDTACSSSLVALHIASSSVLNLECEKALACGVSLTIGTSAHIGGSAANMLSSDGRCKTLDIRADGYAKGECCGVMRITPDIETQSATIDVVAKLGGCGINQDGRSSSLTAPNGPSQQTLIVDVLKRANYNASGVDRLEMHGTGTSLGDPIEVGAALEVLVSSPKSMQTTSSVPFLSSQKRNLTLEGAKTRTGHCEPGAGTVGLMFAISRMSQRLISSLTHLRVLNPHVTSAMSRHNGDAKRQVTLPRQEASRPLYPQQAESVPLCSGVSGFAFQGTNAHALLYGLETQRTRGDGMCSENRLWERQRFWCVVPYHPLTPLYSDVQRRSGTFHAQASVCIDTSQALSSMLDHVINGTALLPGTAHIEMGRALAGLLANEVHGEVSLGSLSFIAPLVLEAKTTVACEVDGHGNISVGVASKTTHHATGLGIRSKARVHKICACALPSLSSDSTSGKGLQVSLPGAKQNYVYSQLYTMREVPYSYYACPAMLDGAFQSSVGATSVGITAVEDMKGSESEQTSNRAIREGSAQNANARVPACISNVSMHGGLTTAMHGFASALIFEECAPTTTHSAVQSSHELWHLDVRRGIIHTHVFLLEGRIIQNAPRQNASSQLNKYNIYPRMKYTRVSHAHCQTTKALHTQSVRAKSVKCSAMAKYDENRCGGMSFLPRLYSAQCAGHEVQSYAYSSSSRIVSVATGLMHFTLCGDRRNSDMHLNTQGNCSDFGTVASFPHDTSLLTSHLSILSAARAAANEGHSSGTLSSGDLPLVATKCMLRSSFPCDFGGLHQHGTPCVERLLPCVAKPNYTASNTKVNKVLGTSSHTMSEARSHVLITGGLGGLGLMTTSWLSQSGGHQSVLSSRSGRNDITPHLLLSKAHQPHVIHIIRGDVSIREEIFRASSHGIISNSDYPKLAGIVHAGGILRDCVLPKQSMYTHRQVWSPKTTGSFHVQNYYAGAERGSNCSVLFSSVSSLLGGAGQVNYSAANAALDASAQYNRSKGESVVSLQWGAWEDTGMAARNGITLHRAVLSGIGVVSPEAGLAVLHNAFFESMHSFHTKHTMPLSGVFTGVAFSWPAFIASDKKPVLREFERNKYTSGKEKDFTSAKVEPNTETDLRGEHISNEVSREERSSDELREIVSEAVTNALGRQILTDASLMDEGMDSLAAVELGSTLQTATGTSMPATLAFDYPTIDAIVGFVAASSFKSVGSGVHTEGTHAIEVSGINSSFMEQNDLVSDLQVNISCSIWFTSMKPLYGISRYEEMSRSMKMERFNSLDMNCSPALSFVPQVGYYIDFIDEFDVQAFKILQAEVEMMDPQQRLLMETVFKSILCAYKEEASDNSHNTGVMVGAWSSNYSEVTGMIKANLNSPFVGVGSERSVLCGRISYTYGLQGPSICTDTACSSSLVALHIASSSVLNLECEKALACGVSLTIGTSAHIGGSAANMLSSDGRCKTLDIRADGYAKGECCGVMRITPDIETQSATIDVVAKLGGCGINQDGRSSSLTAPNGPSQQTLIVDVLKRANYNASGVDRLEMHGTGTSLGDPIEVGAALEVLVSSPKSMQTTSSVPFLSSQKRNLTLEGAKTRTGHCEPGAGTVGLMFAISRMSQRLISSLTHLRVLNPHVTSAMSRHNGDAKRQVTLPRQEASRPLYPQQAESVPLCSGVSGFAFQGTNAHALLYGLETQRTRGDGMCSENRLWERQRFWCVVPYHPLTPLYSDVQRRSGTFHAQASVCIDTSQALSSMLDHVINGTALLPGTAHIEMGRALAGLLANEVHGEVSLGSLSFIAPLVLEAKTTVACEVDGHGNISVGVASKTTHHATGLGIRSKARVHKICACALPSLSSDSTSGKGLQVSLPGAKQNYVYSQLYTMREVPYSYYACPAMLDGAFQSSVGATSVGITAVEDMKGSESEQTSNRAIREGSAQNANARVPACISNVSMHGGLTTAMHGFASALIFEECAPTTTHSAVQSSHELWHLDVRRGIIHTHVFLLEGRIIQKVPTGNFESLSTPIYYQHGGSMEGRYSRTHREIYEGLSRAELGIQISSLLRGILECEIIEDVPLVEQGLDSLGAMELARVLTEMTKIKVHVETLQDNPTLKSLTTFIENEITLGMSTDPSTEKNSKEYGESINRAERKYPRSPRSEKETKARTLLYKYMQVVPWLVLFVFICIFSRLEGEFFDL
ncbi:unnamed protein product [Bathycoccus prasinos]